MSVFSDGAFSGDIGTGATAAVDATAISGVAGLILLARANGLTLVSGDDNSDEAARRVIAGDVAGAEGITCVAGLILAARANGFDLAVEVLDDGVDTSGTTSAGSETGIAASAAGLILAARANGLVLTVGVLTIGSTVSADATIGI